MPRLMMPQYTVIRDIQEKEGHGWFFDPSPDGKKSPICAGTVIEHLKTGDYSLKGYEDRLCIERKAGFFEIWGNYAERDRFEAELERMSKIKYRFILIESSLTPDVMTLSPCQIRDVPGKVITRWLMAVSMKFNVPVMPVGQCGWRIAQQIMENVVQMEKDKWVRY